METPSDEFKSRLAHELLQAITLIVAKDTTVHSVTLRLPIPGGSNHDLVLGVSVEPSQ
jgi:hypothetical protein